MARPLWKDLRNARRQRSLASLPTVATVPLPPRPRWKLALASTAIAVASIILNQTETNGISLMQKGTLSEHAWSAATSGAFLIFGSIAVRRLATQASRIVHVGAGPSAANALRLILTIVGLVIVIISAVIMIGVNPTRLLAAAGITGVILGLAAQQSLGNVFAGIVLMIARPFTVGQRIRVRSGSFGGIFDGEVRAMGLTYVEFMTDDGYLRVPNLGMLAAAVGPAPAKLEQEKKNLYVGRSFPKRPPRATSAAQQAHQRPRRPPAVRRPREIIRQMRLRHSPDPSSAPSPEPGAATKASAERPQVAPPPETDDRPESREGDDGQQARNRSSSRPKEPPAS